MELFLPSLARHDAPLTADFYLLKQLCVCERTFCALQTIEN